MDNNNEFIHEDEQPPKDFEPAQSQTISPLRGFYWLERSLSEIYVPHFKNWFIAALVYSAISLILTASIPFPYSLIVISAVAPLFVAGLLMGAHAIYMKEATVKPLQVFEFANHKRAFQLIVYCISVVILLLAMYQALKLMVDIDSISKLNNSLLLSNNEEQAKIMYKALAPAVPWAILFFLLFLLATWFAVSLILFSGQNAVPAIGNSLLGGLKNFFAILVLVVVVIICSFIIGLIMMLVLTMLGPLISNQYISLIIDIIISALTTPIMVGITYIAYREIFLGDVKKSENSL